MASLSRDWIPFLRKSVFFSGFTEEEMSRLLEKIRLLSLPKGAVLYRQGDDGDALYLIHSGRLRLAVGGPDAKTAAHLGRGDVVGESGLLTGEPRAQTAVVDATAELLVLYKKDFDALLKELPSMAVQLSRLLSTRLVESTRNRAASAPLASRLFALDSRVPAGDRGVIAASLAVALVEQSRRKVLLLDVTDEGSAGLGPALGLEPVRIGESSLRLEDLQSPAVLRRLCVVHPSGLELIVFPAALLEGRLYAGLYPLLATLRRTYDFVLAALPERRGPASRVLLEEADRVLLLEKDALALPDTAEEQLPPGNVRRIHLSEASGAGSGAATAPFRIPWKGGYGRLIAEGKGPFLPPEEERAQRMIDRLARDLSGLKIGFAMGSGAAYGYALIGMLKAFERNGIFPDVISGTSIGALIGGFYAAGKSPAELEDIARSITKRKLLSLADFTLPWQGLLLGRQVLKFLKEVLGEVTFDQLPTPFACVATDISTGEEIVLKQGKVAEAVRASLSLPFYFQPFFYQDHFLVDGGLVNPVPTSLIAALGADVLISANLTAKPNEKKSTRRRPRRHAFHEWRGPNILDVVVKTIYTMQFGIAQTRAEPAHVVLTPDLSTFAWAEFHRAADIIPAGEAYAEEMMPKLKAHMPFFADSCQVPLARPAAARGF